MNPHNAILPKLHVSFIFGAYSRGGSVAGESVLDSKSRLELRGLEKLQEYEFRATYIGIDIAPNFSNTVTAIVV